MSKIATDAKPISLTFQTFFTVCTNDVPQRTALKKICSIARTASFLKLNVENFLYPIFYLIFFGIYPDLLRPSSVRHIAADEQSC